MVEDAKSDRAGKPKYLDVNELLHKSIPVPSAMAHELRGLYQELCLLRAGAAPQTPASIVPAPPVGGPMHLDLALWQMSYLDKALLRGAPSTCEVLNVVQKIFLDEEHLNTVKYQLEVVFGLAVPQMAGEAIGDFSVGISVGGTTLTAAFAVVKFAMDLQVWNRPEFAGQSEAKSKLVACLLSCLELHALYDPAVSFDAQIQKSIKTKAAAANRARPTPLQLLAAFALQVARSTSGRRTFEELVGLAVQSYNKAVGVKSEQINADEVASVKFLAGRCPEFLAVLKGIWNGEKIMYTSMPLSLLTAPFLRPDVELPVAKKDNPVWFGILTPSEPKYIAWLQRCDGRFTSRVAETQIREKRPNLRSFSASYRDPEAEREIVWRMACLWIASLSAQQQLCSAEVIAIKEKKFFSGQLDEDMKHKARSLDPSFKFEDLRFLREEQSSQLKSATSASDTDVAEGLAVAERSKDLAELEVFKFKLRNEAAAFSDYRLRVQEFEDRSDETVRSHQDKLHEAVERAVEAHSEGHFAVDCLETFAAIPNWLDQRLLKFACSQTSRRSEEVLRIEILSLSAMGPQFAPHLTEMGSKLACSLSAHPARTCGLVVLPNCPAWGAGGGGQLTGAVLDDCIATARRDVLAEFSKSEHGVLVREVVGLYDQQAMYSAERSLQCQMLMVISKAADSQGKLVSQFAKSAMWKRHAIPGLLQPLPRSEFKDWTRSLDHIAASNTDSGLERRQWHSGAAFWASVISAVFDKLGLSTAQAAHIREWALYDDGVSKAVMELMKQQGRHMPALGYAGATFCKFVRNRAGTVVAANVQTAIKDALAFHYKSKQYTFPGAPTLSDAPAPAAGARPVEPTAFEICQPRGAELPIKQSTLDLFEGKPSDVQTSLAELVKEHNTMFNKGGVPWKVKRVNPDEPLERMEAAAAIVLPRRAEAPAAVTSLTAPVVTVPGARGAEGAAPGYELIADGKGQLFLKGLQDGVASNLMPLLVLRGKYLPGNPGAALMASAKTNWVEFKLAADSMVLPTVKTDKAHDIKTEPMELQKMIAALERLGHVQPKLRMHEVKRRKPRGPESGGSLVGSEELHLPSIALWNKP